MILIKSSNEEESLCYVETKNLDGETNLKTKYVPQDLAPLSNQRGFIDELLKDRRNLTLNVEEPNNMIYKFDGNMQFSNFNQNSRLIDAPSNTKTIALNNEHVLLRGMSLKNTEKVWGIVIYTGHETKL